MAMSEMDLTYHEIPFVVHYSRSTGGGVDITAICAKRTDSDLYDLFTLAALYEIADRVDAQDSIARGEYMDEMRENDRANSEAAK